MLTLGTTITFASIVLAGCSAHSDGFDSNQNSNVDYYGNALTSGSNNITSDDDDALSLAGASTSDNGIDDVAICIDKTTQERLDDAKCAQAPETGTGAPIVYQNASHHTSNWLPMWVMYNAMANRSIPAVGTRASNYLTSPVVGHTYAKGGFSAQGGLSGDTSKLSSSASVFSKNSSSSASSKLGTSSTVQTQARNGTLPGRSSYGSGSHGSGSNGSIGKAQGGVTRGGFGSGSAGRGSGG